MVRWHDPTPWQYVLLLLASYRIWRLIAWDTITASLRWRLVGYSDEAEPIADYTKRPALAYWVHCPWCMGFWTCLLVALAWWVAPTATIAASVPLALSTGVGLIRDYEKGD